jgi:hypothetical protein
MEEYKVKPGGIYNMDVKGFLTGITGSSKRVFSTRMWRIKRLLQAFKMVHVSG